MEINDFLSAAKVYLHAKETSKCSWKELKDYLQTLSPDEGTRDLVMKTIRENPPLFLEFHDEETVSLSQCYVDSIGKIKNILLEDGNGKLSEVIHRSRKSLSHAQRKLVGEIPTILDISGEERISVKVCDKMQRFCEAKMKMHHYFLLEGLQDVIDCLSEMEKSSVEDLWKSCKAQSAPLTMQKVGMSVSKFEKTLNSYPDIFHVEDGLVTLISAQRITYSLIVSHMQSATRKLRDHICSQGPLLKKELFRSTSHLLSGAEVLAVGGGMETFTFALESVRSDFLIIPPHMLVIAPGTSQVQDNPFVSAVTKMKDFMTKENIYSAASIDQLVTFVTKEMTSCEQAAVGSTNSKIRETIAAYPNHFGIERNTVFFKSDAPILPGACSMDTHSFQMTKADLVDDSSSDQSTGHSQGSHSPDPSQSTGGCSLRTLFAEKDETSEDENSSLEADEVESLGSESISDSDSIHSGATSDAENIEHKASHQYFMDQQIITVLQDLKYFGTLIKEFLSKSTHMILSVSLCDDWLIVVLWNGPSFAIHLTDASFVALPEQPEPMALDFLTDPSILKVVFDARQLTEISNALGIEMANIFDFTMAESLIRPNSKRSESLPEALRSFGIDPYPDVEVCLGTLEAPVSGDVYPEEHILKLQDTARWTMKQVPCLYQMILEMMTSGQMSDVGDAEGEAQSDKSESGKPLLSSCSGTDPVKPNSKAMPKTSSEKGSEKPNPTMSSKNFSETPESITTTKDSPENLDSVIPSMTSPEKPESITSSEDNTEEPDSIIPSMTSPEKPESITTTEDSSVKPESVTPSKTHPEKPKSITSSENSSEEPDSVTPSKTSSEKPNSITSSEDNTEEPDLVNPSKSIPETPKSITTSEDNTEEPDTVTPSKTSPEKPESTSSEDNPEEPDTVTPKTSPEKPKSITLSENSSEEPDSVTPSKTSSEKQDSITSKTSPEKILSLKTSPDIPDSTSSLNIDSEIPNSISSNSTKANATFPETSSWKSSSVNSVKTSTAKSAPTTTLSNNPKESTRATNAKKSSSASLPSAKSKKANSSKTDSKKYASATLPKTSSKTSKTVASSKISSKDPDSVTSTKTNSKTSVQNSDSKKSMPVTTSKATSRNSGTVTSAKNNLKSTLISEKSMLAKSSKTTSRNPGPVTPGKVDSKKSTSKCLPTSSTNKFIPLTTSKITTKNLEPATSPTANSKNSETTSNSGKSGKPVTLKTGVGNADSVATAKNDTRESTSTSNCEKFSPETVLKSTFNRPDSITSTKTDSTNTKLISNSENSTPVTSSKADSGNLDPVTSSYIKNHDSVPTAKTDSKKSNLSSKSEKSTPVTSSNTGSGNPSHFASPKSAEDNSEKPVSVRLVSSTSDDLDESNIKDSAHSRNDTEITTSNDAPHGSQRMEETRKEQAKSSLHATEAKGTTSSPSTTDSDTIQAKPPGIDCKVLHYDDHGKPIMISSTSKLANQAINPCMITHELARDFNEMVRHDQHKLLEAFSIAVKFNLEKFVEDDRSYALDQLTEVVMDVGRKPTARYYQSEDPGQLKVKTIVEKQLTKKDLKDFLKGHCTPVSKDNRSSIRGTLHRIGIMTNRQNEPIGLTALIKYPVLGCATPLFDLMNQGQSILFVGNPGVGKSTMLREAARVINDVVMRRVVIVDSCNEIAGEGDIPHPSIGGARRVQLKDRDLQPSMTREVVRNHSPQTVIIDEVTTESDAAAVLGARQRGIQVICSAPGQTLQDVILNSNLRHISGRIQNMAIGHSASRDNLTTTGPTTTMQRTQAAVFDILVEMYDRYRWIVHQDFTRSIDLCLQKVVVGVQERRVFMKDVSENFGGIPQITVRELVAMYPL